MRVVSWLGRGWLLRVLGVVRRGCSHGVGHHVCGARRERKGLRVHLDRTLGTSNKLVNSLKMLKEKNDV